MYILSLYLMTIDMIVRETNRYAEQETDAARVKHMSRLVEAYRQ